MDRSAGVEKLAGSRRRALIMINRKARSAATSLDEAIALLGDSGITVREEALPSPDQLVDVIQRHADTIDCVIIGGGGGTLNAAAPALLETGLPLGILPLGTRSSTSSDRQGAGCLLGMLQAHGPRFGADPQYGGIWPPSRGIKPSHEACARGQGRLPQ
jgi:hypothetical protein